MTKRLNSKHKVDRRLKVNLWGRPKSPFNARAYPPGQHGQTKSSKPSDYGVQLQAKQRLKSYYGNINERQFRNLYRKAIMKKGDTAENLIGLLERRLDAIVYRAKLSTTIFSSRQLINQSDGTLLLPDIKAAIRYQNDHFPPTKLICLENTHNLCNGSPLEKDYISNVVEIAKSNSLKVHVDGARIFNASAALGVSPSDLNEGIDSVSFCLSKGLSAPIGSLLCGSKNFIKKARRIRKALGGGMRQGGIVAAAGKYALEHMVSRISEDHRLARKLAEGLSNINFIYLNPKDIRTNIIYFKFKSDRYSEQVLLDTMKKKGILFLESSPGKFRMVTHSCVNENDIDYTIKELVKFLGEK